jgi:uncharacterized protein (DUF2461 family)
VRDAIVARPGPYKKAIAFHKRWSISGESLKRPPRGYDPDHALIDELKRKDHIAVCDLTHSDLTKKGFLELVAERFAETKPYMRFQAKALALPF